ncbi:disease resistance protein L6-like [Syzygium oleosum]|uniref:disease resistance protein L6-like n=1 Tax=Syzygium oleosum TaxID=219896 RepID=UPI0024B8ECB8|nr:disease resistance protein L6-like [Syzygium oleosum]
MGQSLTEARNGMHRCVYPFALFVLLILLSTYAFHDVSYRSFPNHPEKEKKSAEKDRVFWFVCLIRTEEGYRCTITVIFTVFEDDNCIPTGKEFGSQILDAITRSKISIPIIYRYDIFLSFRGSDTRKGFIGYLHRRLVNAGIRVFKDDNSIPTGKEFGSQILDAITRSKISIPIISENYASSKWCLLELIHIMDSQKSTSHIVLPIFYKVHPSHVRYLKGSFGKAFHSRKKCFDEKVIQEGQRALREVSQLHGWESENIANGHEVELVEKVIKDVLSKLGHDYRLDVTEHLVGIGDHVKRIKNWVNNPASDARMIGIYGMGGIGKTTLAKVIYNELSNDFVHRSFLLDIRETAHRNGIPYLQNQLIKDILQIEHQVSTVDNGISLIKSRFKGEKVLILLDDIDRKDHLNALARERNWFTSGSIIIVTTRNKVVLDQSKFEVDYKCELNEMDEVQSLLLFNRHAFRMNHSSKDFEGISRDIISNMGGLPLAIEVVGSSLYGKMDPKVWQDILKKLRKEPHRDVQKILKISYDALEDAHKQIFLDIACFFIGEESKFAIYMWDDREFYPSEGIEELKLRCLIKVDKDCKLRMHDQLRDLGRNIIRLEGPLGDRSRLWANEEASRVLMEKKGTERIQAIRLDQQYGHLQTYKSEQFKNMQSLRFLQLRRATFSGDFNNLFRELRWLRWFDIESDLWFFLRTNLHLPNLRVLELSFDQKTKHWTGWSSIKTAKRLKVLHLAHCNYLRCTPDLSTFTELEILIVKKSPRLEQVHPSIGKVKSLISLDLSDCGSLKELPREVGELEELKELSLDFAGIAKFPTSIGSLRKLEKLSCGGCRSLREIPGSIGELSSLKVLDITRAPIFELPESIQSLSSLQHLSLWGCHELRSLPKLPSSLTYLTISCQSPRLPKLSYLIHLEELHLYGCNQLESIPELPSRPLKLCVDSCNKLIFAKLDRSKYLEELSIKNCSSIKRLDLSQLSHLKRLHIEDCNNLVEIQGYDELESLEEIVIYRCKSIERMILPGLQCLKQLKVSSCDNLVEIQGLDMAKSLEALDISDCGSFERLPDLSCFATLTELNLAGCKALKTLPNLSKFENLENLTMRYLLGVTEIVGVEDSKSLTHIDITGCKSMEILPDLSGCEKLQSLVLRDCKKLTQLQGLEKLNLIYLDISGCDSLETIPKLPGTRIFRNYERAWYEVHYGNIILR